MGIPGTPLASASDNQSYSGNTVKSSIDKEGLKYLLDETLSNNNGLKDITESGLNSGVYNSATNEMLVNDLITRQAGVVAANNKTITTNSSTNDVKGGVNTVLCTYYASIGKIPIAEYQSAGEQCKKLLTMSHVRGYHSWAIPLVLAMRKSSIWADFLTMLFRPLIVGWVNWMNGIPSPWGCIAWYVMRPICYFLGRRIYKKNTPMESYLSMPESY